MVGQQDKSQSFKVRVHECAGIYFRCQGDFFEPWWRSASISFAALAICWLPWPNARHMLVQCSRTEDGGRDVRGIAAREIATDGQKSVTGWQRGADYYPSVVTLLS